MWINYVWLYVDADTYKKYVAMKTNCASFFTSVTAFWNVTSWDNACVYTKLKTHILKLLSHVIFCIVHLHMFFNIVCIVHFIYENVYDVYKKKILLKTLKMLYIYFIYSMHICICVYIHAYCTYIHMLVCVCEFKPILLQIYIYILLHVYLYLYILVV